MSFSQDWFEKLSLNNFEQLKQMFLKKEDPINYLEIGVYEGNCHLWMHKNMLIHKHSRSTAIDPFETIRTANSYNQFSTSYNRFVTNLGPYLSKMTILKGYSDDILPTLEKDSFDIIYIDGDHASGAVYSDATNSFKLLKKGGIMIFDDYMWHIREMKNGTVDTPFKGVNKFVTEYENSIKILDGFSPPIKVIQYDDIDIKSIEQNPDKYNWQVILAKI